jgi:hypothetical protein
MKRESKSAQGKAKVDLLNSISEMSEFLGAGWDTVLMRRKYDTIKRYGNMAYELANQIKYNDGIAMALINLNQHGSPESLSQGPLKDKDIREANFRKAITMAEETRNYEILAKAYSQLPDQSGKAEHYFILAKDTEALASIYTWAAEDYIIKGNYEKGMEYGEKALDYLKNENVKLVNWHQFLVQECLQDMATLYIGISDYENAIKCLRESNQFAERNKTGWTTESSIAYVFCEMHQYDSAMYYWNYWRNGRDWNKMAGGAKAFGYAIRAKIFLSNQQYDSALKIHWRNIEWMKPYNNKYAITREWIYISNVYRENGNYDSALFYGTKGLTGMVTFNDRPLMMKSYEILSSIYHHLHNNDSAYHYLLKYITIKDSIENKQLLLRLYKQKLDASNQQAKSSLAMLTKDNALQSEQLKKEAQQKTFLLTTLMVLLLAGYFYYRYISLKRKNERLHLENQLRLQQLESEKKHAELKRQASELQMQALRVQMNPHFIFNSLSSINWFIMENEKDRASDYLTRFSRLMRMVLNAQKPMIPLEDELKMIQLYLDMERMRFNNSFDYNISFTNAVDAGTISIPPMLLQPFCENAIWHGFMNLPADGQGKEGQGRLVINIHTTENMLECTITDNGVGRKQAALSKNRSPRKERSLGLEITRERLALLSEENDAQANFSIVDLEDEQGLSKGTQVILRIVYKTYIEKVA